ncbi:peptidoglycan-binding domain-containing protein [Kitasatospora sp. MAP5-34]|uniref:peptidoglycan-binding domain-containing protein n=1 Tax=Kitasatospora sp. MAP5-34 TaxID=3035102 RepID=UPI0024748376|nr:peptidoglycan-binding domain-containing protein [Kitasatospora sp. MAP5-34]MDH6574952.1 peptidoglycan hydrolase-like protein with peptidoglycan-binding domain [Kitasatospora sp. MAP5-34]
MPGQHCPVCGAVPTPAGCACHQHPDFEETAVLPQLDGPELVRPYVPAAALLPPVPADDFPTAMMPQVPDYEPTPIQPPYEQPAYQQPAHGQQQSAAGGRAEQRARQRQSSPGRRRAVILSAGAGIAAVGAGLALLVSPFSDGGHGSSAAAVPLAVSTSEATLPAASVSAVPSPSASDSPSPSPSRTKATHKPTASPTPSAVSSPPVTQAASPSPSPSPTTPSATPSTDTPTSSGTVATPGVLQYGDSGDQVLALQQKLAVVLCWMHVKVNGSFGSNTEQAVSYFQSMQGVQGDPDGVAGPNTQAALAQRSGC